MVVSVPGPEEFPALESRLATDPTNVGALTRLGAGYREAGRLDEARDLLERALTQDASSGPATFFLGLTYEDLGNFTDARVVYTAYLDQGNSALRDEIEARLPIMRRAELQASITQALASEEAFTPDARAVAVFPFQYSGASPDYQPLSRALAAMLITDLSQTDRLTVVERLHVQLLLDEVALSQSEWVDPATAVQGGRVTGAANVVQGVLGGDADRITLDASVVDVRTDPTQAPELADESDATAIVDLEKRTAFAIYESLGIELTVAERERVSQRWTDNLQALLAFGLGLEAEDRGDYAAAAAEYRRAAQIDPSFSQAADQAGEADVVGDAGTTTTADLAAAATTELLDESGFGDFTDMTEALAGVESLVPTSGERDVAVESLGTEGFRPAILTITIRPPGGNQ